MYGQRIGLHQLLSYSRWLRSHNFEVRRRGIGALQSVSGLSQRARRRVHCHQQSLLCE